MMRISLVTPVYRCAVILDELHRRAVAAITQVTRDYEIVLVIDGLPDDLAKAEALAERDPRVVVVDLSRNFGQHPALMAGLEVCTGDLVFICDSDLEDEPEWIVPFHAALRDGAHDVAYGVQTARKGSRRYRLSRRLFWWALHKSSGIDFPPNIVTARLMTRRYVDALLRFGERELFAAGIWHMTGFSQIGVPIAKRASSATTYTLGKLTNLFVNAVTAFSVRPLQAISVVGFVLFAAALGFIGWLVVRRLVFGIGPEGWTSVMATILLIGGVTLLLNGILAVYLSKIFLEVKQRPRTIVRRVLNDPSQRAGARREGEAGDAYRAIVAHYEACLAEHGSGAAAVNWKDEESAAVRYDVMLDLLPAFVPGGAARGEGERVTLLDFGCGLGELKAHMEKRGLTHVDYVGLDISPAYTQAARERWPGATFLCLDVLEKPDALPVHDYVVMNGIFTRRHTMGHAAMRAYMERLLGTVWRRTARGLAFNVMSRNVDWTSGELFHPSFDEIADTVSRAASRRMVLRDDYGLYETTCYVRREPGDEPA